MSITYTRRKKKEAVAQYRETGKLMATAREFGISKNTLKKWSEEISDEALKNMAEKADVKETLLTQNELKKALANEADMRVAYMGELHEPLMRLSLKVIDKAERMLPSCRNIGDVTRLLEVMLKHYEVMRPSDDKTSDKEISSIRQSIININIARDKAKRLETQDIEPIEPN